MPEKKKRTRSEIGRSNRRSGSAYENKVGQIMDKVWFNGVRRVRRTPASGGYDKRFICGDLIDAQDAENWPLCCEVKERENWSFDGIAKGGGAEFWKWWDENLEVLDKWLQYNDYLKQPLLIFTKSYYPNYVMCEGNMSKLAMKKIDPNLTLYRDGKQYHIFILEDFLNAVKIADLRKLAERK